MTDLIKKGVYLRPEQVQILARLVYESRSAGKRYVSESMLVRVAVALLTESKIDVLDYQSEQEMIDDIRKLYS